MIGEEILLEIDTTLDQLIQNAEALQKANIQELSETEIEAFQKTQESLIHHFLYMDGCWTEKKKNLKVLNQRSAQCKIQEKLGKFEKLKSACSQTLSKGCSNRASLILKRRSKRLLYRESV
ncbi:MAG TPA: hypothetical protein VJK48_00775 [Chlamydiales bacterium]|nr:MAG: hypothetical protein A3F67_11605 [Verrucomicrobia bacterium RIFCSPHIGHO2_12_FULL_41_10]HLB52228.1 hypothetical protein [Chlamydiales bacterium]